MVVKEEGNINYLTLMQSLPSSTIHSYAPVVFEPIVHPRAEEAKKKGMTVEQLEEVERKLAQGNGVVFQDTGSDANNYHKAIAGNDPEINAREQNRRSEGEAKAKQETAKAVDAILGMTMPSTYINTYLDWNGKEKMPEEVSTMVDFALPIAGSLVGGAGIKGFKLATSNVQKFRLASKLNRSISTTKLNPTEIDKAILSGKVGWAPAQDITWRHGSDNPTLREFVPYNRWDVLNRGASPYEYFVTRQGSSTNMMDGRPYQYTGVFHSSKPMVQLNEFNIAGQKNATRNQLLSQARSRGADSYILENIADNKAKNQDVVVRFIDSKGEPIYPQQPSNSRTLTESNGAVSRMVEPTNTSAGRTSLAFYERPSILTEGERAGIPKGDRFYQDPEILKNAKQFAEKYGYDVPSTIEEAKQMYRQHNSFFRTTLDPQDVITSIQESDPKLAAALKGLSREEQVKLLASKGYPSAFRGYNISEYPEFADDFVFVSPSVEANLPYIETAGNNNTTVLLRRPFSFNNPKTWHIDADWRPFAADELIEYPRAKGVVQIGNVSPKQELKISTDHLIPVKLATENDKGTNLGTYLSTENKKHGGKMNYLDFFKPGGTVNPVLDAASYMIPIYGTYRSIKDAIAEPTWQNIGLAGASALGDALTVFGVGAGIKGGVAAARAGKVASSLSKAANTAHATASNIARISEGATKAATKTKQAVNAATLLPEATQSQIIALQRRASAASKLAQQASAASKASAEIPTTLFDMSAVKAAEAARKTNQATQWYKAAGATTLGSSAFDAAGQSFKNGGYIDFFKNGNGIHIKKKNEGKFTEYCGGKVTEECIQKGKHSSNPTTRKRATFAENARHFKHQTGGRVFMQATKVRSDDSTPLTRLWDFVSDYNSNYEPEKLTITSTESPKDQDFSGYTLLGTPISKSAGKMHQDLVDLQNLFTKYNLPITITSGYREGAVTSNGSPSFHATGEAMDIIPTEGHTFQEIADIIRNTPEIADFMKSHKLGVLDETSKEMLARTGGTGAHYHVGRDKSAQAFWI